MGKIPTLPLVEKDDLFVFQGTSVLIHSTGEPKCDFSAVFKLSF